MSATEHIDVLPRNFEESGGVLFALPEQQQTPSRVIASTASEKCTCDNNEDVIESPPHMAEVDSITGFIATHKVLLGFILATVVIIIIAIIIYRYTYTMLNVAASTAAAPQPIAAVLDKEPSEKELQDFLTKTQNTPPVKITQTAVLAAGPALPAVSTFAVAMPQRPRYDEVAPEMAPEVAAVVVDDSAPTWPLSNIDETDDELSFEMLSPNNKEKINNDDIYMDEPHDG